MRAVRLAATGVAAISLVLGALGPVASASAGNRLAPRDHGHDDCGDPSHASTKPSKFNTTPNGGGPWKVRLDPCNTEGAGSESTPYYNCAYWAAEKRPDVWVNAVLLYGYSSTKPGAWRIRVDARKAGYPITRRPKAGDIAAWARNATMGTTATGITYTASPGGHVAYVERVLTHHRITLSSMGQGSDGGYTTTIKFARHTSFIHQLPDTSDN
jgi:surface antigen